LVMVTNQDGLGTSSFPEETFWPTQNFLIKTFKNEGITFSEVYIDNSFPDDMTDTRKPRTGMLTPYLDRSKYNMDESYVIGDRMTDMELAKNMGAKGIFIANDETLGVDEVKAGDANDSIALKTIHWEAIYNFLKLDQRIVVQKRTTHETDIDLILNLDGTGKSEINTGIAFFDHMLDQIARHGAMDLELNVKGDLEVDEHHTIEDTAIALGEVLLKHWEIN